MSDDLGKPIERHAQMSSKLSDEYYVLETGKGPLWHIWSGIHQGNAREKNASDNLGRKAQSFWILNCVPQLSAYLCLTWCQILAHSAIQSRFVRVFVCVCCSTSLMLLNNVVESALVWWLHRGQHDHSSIQSHAKYNCKMMQNVSCLAAYALFLPTVPYFTSWCLYKSLYCRGPAKPRSGALGLHQPASCIYCTDCFDHLLCAKEARSRQLRKINRGIVVFVVPPFQGMLQVTGWVEWYPAVTGCSYKLVNKQYHLTIDTLFIDAICDSIKRRWALKSLPVTYFQTRAKDWIPRLQAQVGRALIRDWRYWAWLPTWKSTHIWFHIDNMAWKRRSTSWTGNDRYTEISRVFFENYQICKMFQPVTWILHLRMLRGTRWTAQ